MSTKLLPKQADELDVHQACKRLKLSISELESSSLHSRRLSSDESIKLGVSYERIKVYKASPGTAAHAMRQHERVAVLSSNRLTSDQQVADVKALAEQLTKRRRSASKRKRASTVSDAWEPEWYRSQLCCCCSLPSPASKQAHIGQQMPHRLHRHFEDSGGGTEQEIDEMKVAEHFKLPASQLNPLPYRTLSREVC